MTAAGLAPDTIRTMLTAHGLLPADATAVLLGGSMARGWQHARSDVDLYVVSPGPWTGPSNGYNSVAVTPEIVPTTVTHAEGRRWELRYWSESQVAQTFRKIGWPEFKAGDLAGRPLSPHETAFLSRLSSAVAVTGTGWLHRTCERLAGSAFRAMLMVRALNDTDAAVEDALGMMEAGDVPAAVLAARAALDAASDALTLHHGDYGLEAKWRARRVRAAGSTILPFEDYWALTTMRDLVPERPEHWIEAVLHRCRQIAVEVEVGP